MNTRKILTAMLLAVLITAAVGIVAADSEAEGASPRLTLTSAEYDNSTDILTVSGTSTEKQLWFQITDSEGTLKVSSESIIVRNGAYIQDVLLKGYAVGTYTVTVYIEEGYQKISESKEFAVTGDTVSITPERHGLGLFVDETLYMRFSLTGCSYDRVTAIVEDSAIATADAMASDCRVAVTGLSAGSTVLRVSCADTCAEVFVTVSERAVPPQPLEFTFGIQMKVDSEAAVTGSSGYTASNLAEGITLKGTGMNAGEALENACNAKHIPNEFSNGKDADGNDLRYWVAQLFGAGDVKLDGGNWKYWLQEHDGELNLRTLGWYTDNAGVYTLTYMITGEDLRDEVRSVYIKEQPTKTEYTVGESFDPAGMVVMADMYLGGDIPVADYTATPTKFTEAGKQNVTITYKGARAAVQVTVSEPAPPAVESIAVSKLPDKTEYTVGESFDPAGMSVTASMSDGTSKTISGYTTSPSKFTEAGKQNVTVSYGGKTASFEVTVVAEPAPAVSITPNAHSLKLYAGDSGSVSFTLIGCTYDQVHVVSSDSGKVTVGRMASDCTVTVHAEEVGTAKVRVSCGGVFAEVDVTVDERPPSTTEKKFTFFIKVEIDIESAVLGNSGITENNLESGITITGKGTNAGEALENACNANGIPNEFLTKTDANGNDLRYWVTQIFGLGDELVGGYEWKSWVQEHDGSYNKKTLGWYEDNSGTYSLTYKITGMGQDNKVESIYISEQPDRTVYTVGEPFDPAGMVVMAKMTIGGDKQVLDYDVSPERFTSAGKQNVTVTYRGESAEVAVTVTGSYEPPAPGGDTEDPDDGKDPESEKDPEDPKDPDDGTEIPEEDLEDKETTTDRVTNDDGSTTTTTTTTGKTGSGESVKIVDKVTEKDGVSTGTKTETVIDKDGNEIGNRVTESTKDKDGNTTSKTAATKTEEDGSKTSSTSESKLDKDGNGTSKSESVTTNTDGTSVSEKSTTERSEDKVQETKVTETKDADGKTTGKQTESKTEVTLKDSEGNETGTMKTEVKETVGKDGKSEKTEDVAVESKDGNVKTEATSKTDKDGNVKAESKTTMKSETKDVGTDAIDAALKQSEQALSNMSADKTEITKTVEVEVSSGTSAALSPEAVKKVSDYGAGLKVSVSEGSIDTDSDVLKNLAKDGKTVELSIEANNRDVLKDKQKDIVGDNHFVDLNALVGGENVHQLGGKAVITFGYQLKDGESSADLKVFYVDDDGNKTLVDASFENGSFTMTVDHFSVYMVENTAAPTPVDPEDKDEGGISPVLIAGIVIAIVAAIAGVFLYTRKN